jgi:transcriptional regulator with XRE-family HTH domain
VIQPSPADDLPGLIRTALDGARISQAEACRRLGLSTKHLNQMLMGRVTLTLPWAERLLALCGQSLVIDAVPTTGAPDNGPRQMSCGHDVTSRCQNCNQGERHIRIQLATRESELAQLQTELEHAQSGRKQLRAINADYRNALKRAAASIQTALDDATGDQT